MLRASRLAAVSLEKQTQLFFLSLPPAATPLSTKGRPGARKEAHTPGD